jgi:hypothetical protein
MVSQIVTPLRSNAIYQNIAIRFKRNKKYGDYKFWGIRVL